MNSTEPIDFNRVADLYDIYVRTEFDIHFWLNASKAARGKTLELACGTGRVSLPLLRAGIDLTCVDYAPEMLARFRKKLEDNNLSCPIYCQDMSALDLPKRFDLIFIPFHSFSEIIDRKKQRLALQRIRSHLTPHGTFICTLQNPQVRATTMDGKFRPIGEFAAAEGGTLIVGARMTFDPTTQIASGEQVYEQLSPGGALRDRRVLRINFYLFQRHEFESLLRESGFTVNALYGDYDRHAFEDASSPFMIWELTRTPDP